MAILGDAVILIVDDEVEICELVSMYLSQEGYQTPCVHDGPSAIQAAMEDQPDLILLDNLLPGLDGVEVCSRLRRYTNAPILFMSCKGEETDKIIALGVGGDDYIVKPFSPRELVARVKAHLRRHKQSTYRDVLQFGDLRIDITIRSVFSNGKRIKLSGTEFDILLLLAQQPGVVFGTEEIFRKLWSVDDLEDTRTVLVHISNLRKKIEIDPSQPAYILTVWGIGYQFNRVWARQSLMPYLDNEISK